MGNGISIEEELGFSNKVREMFVEKESSKCRRSNDKSCKFRCESSDMLWQTMEWKWFDARLRHPTLQLKLKHLKGYDKTAETKQYVRIVKEIIPECLINGYMKEVADLNDLLVERFEKIDERTYISCFYHKCLPSVNMLKHFGGDIGVSVGFNRHLIEDSISEYRRNYCNGRVDIAFGDVKYIAGTKEQLDRKAKVFSDKVRELQKNRDENSTIKLRDLVAVYLFGKSHYFADESEYRIVLGMDPSNYSEPLKIESIKLPLTAISKIAVENREDAKDFVDNNISNYVNYSIDKIEGANDYFDHPLTFYKVRPKITKEVNHE